tara:strand:+ start:315 stop:752 length:438 start_codon:yes stop_codon:yes gene_type:complete
LSSRAAFETTHAISAVEDVLVRGEAQKSHHPSPILHAGREVVKTVRQVNWLRDLVPMSANEARRKLRENGISISNDSNLDSVFALCKKSKAEFFAGQSRAAHYGCCQETQSATNPKVRNSSTTGCYSWSPRVIARVITDGPNGHH